MSDYDAERFARDTVIARSIVAQMEFVTARAQHDLARYGEWQCDYTTWLHELREELEAVLPESKPKPRVNGKLVEDNGEIPF